MARRLYPMRAGLALVLSALLEPVAAGAVDASSLLEQSRRSLADESGQFEQWCNGTVVAQDGRRAALRQLLAQVQASSGDRLQQIHQLTQEVADLGTKLESARVAVESASRDRGQKVTLASLNIEDAARDVEVLSHAQKDKSLNKVLGSLYKQAQGEKSKLQAALQLLQAKSDSTEVSTLEKQYQSKQGKIDEVQHQYYTTQRSLEVLTAAIEDESAYLAVLDGVCTLGKEAYGRVRAEAVPSLQKAAHDLAEQKGGNTAKLNSAATSSGAAAPASPAEEPKPKASLAAALRSLPAAPAAPKLAGHKADAAPAAHQASPAAAMPAAPAAPATPAPPVAPASAPTAAVAPKAQPKPKVFSAVQTADEDVAARTAAALAGYDLSDDDSDDKAPATPAPKSAAKPAAAKKLAAAKPAPAVHHATAKPAAKAAVAPKAAHSLAHKKAAKKAATKPEPAKAAPPATADDDDAVDAPAAAKPEAAKEAAPAATADDDDAGDATPAAKPMAAKKKATHTVAAVAEDADADAPAAAAPPVAPAKHHKAHGKHKKKGNDFMDDVYKSAAGSMPTQYTAWTPDGAAPHDAHDDTKFAVTSADEAKKKMSAMFDNDDDKDLFTATTDAHAKSAPATPTAAPAAPAATDASVESSKPAPAAAVKTAHADADTSSDDDSAPAAPPAPKPVAKVAKHTAKASQLQTAKSPEDDDSDKLDADSDTSASSAAPAEASKKDDDADASSDDPLPSPHKAHAAVAVHAAKDDSSDLSDDDDAPKVVSHSHRAKAAVVPKHADSDDADLTADTSDDAAPAPVAEAAKPMKHKKAARQLTEEEEAAKAFGYDFDDDDDSAAAPAVAAPPPVRKARARKAKKHHAAPAPPPMDLDLDDDMSAPAKSVKADAPVDVPATISAPVPAAKNMAKELDDTSDHPHTAAHLPGQYSAWTPSDAEEAAKQKQAMLAKMESDFDSDDDAPPAPTPRRHRGHKKAAPKPTEAPVMKDDDGVVYDDDDLPKHPHKSIAAELQGGWRSLMKTSAHKTKKPKLDPDIAIMQSLYSDSGSLPSQYTAWSPGEAEAKAQPAPAAGSASSSDDSSDDSSDGDAASFLQLSAVPDFAALLKEEAAAHHTPIDALVADAVGASKPSGSAFLERSAERFDALRVSAAHSLLQQYADVLKSQALSKLAKAKPSPPKLMELSKQLRAVDPLEHPGVIAAKGREAQAEQWCTYFRKHEGAANPVHKALAQLQASSLALANISSQRAAVSEEVDARTQLKTTLEQDVQGLSSMLTSLQAAGSSSGFATLEKQLAASGRAMAPEALIEVGEASAVWRDAHAEIADALRDAIHRRQDALAMQTTRLAALQQEAAAKDKVVALQQAQVAKAKSQVDLIRKKMQKIGVSCDATLKALEQRRHARHMEAHAVDMALKVLK